MLINVFDFLDAQGKPDLQAALDAAEDGDAIYLPGARVYQAPAGGWIIRKRIELFGDGPGKKDSYLGTVLVPAGMTDPVLVLDAPDNTSLQNISLHDFQITRPQGQSGRFGGDGIMYKPPPPPPPPPDPPIEKKLSQPVIERVSIFHLAGSAFSLLGANGGESAIVDLHMVDCIAEDCGGYGLTLKNGFGTNLMHCLFKGNGKAGVRAELSGLALYQCVLDGNTSSQTDDAEASLHCEGCHTVRVEACRIVNFTTGATGGAVKRALICTSTSEPFAASGGALVVGGCYFEVAAGAPQGTGIHVPLGQDVNGPVLVLPNRFLRVANLVDVGMGVTGCIVLALKQARFHTGNCDRRPGSSRHGSPFGEPSAVDRCSV